MDDTPTCLISRRSKMKLFYGPMMLAVLSTWVILASGLSLADNNPATMSQMTTGLHGLNLNGKMLTFSSTGVSFYPPYFSSTSPPLPSTPPYRLGMEEDIRYTTINPPQTSASPTRGVSMCLRYLCDYEPKHDPTIFTLSPSRSPLILESSAPHRYRLHIGGYSQNSWYGNDYLSLSFKPNIKFWSNVGPDIWTRVCLTVDTEKKVAQVFRGSRISVRKMLPKWYVWPGEPVINFSGFDGQVTDVQMWDYPIDHIEIYNYMTDGVYGPNLGSILTWSSISYSPRENVLLEDVYKWQTKHPISGRRGNRRRPKGKKKTREFECQGNEVA